VQFTRATNVNMTGGSTSKKYMGYLRKGLGNKYVSLNLLAATFRGNLRNFTCLANLNFSSFLGSTARLWNFAILIYPSQREINILLLSSFRLWVPFFSTVMDTVYPTLVEVLDKDPLRFIWNRRVHLSIFYLTARVTYPLPFHLSQRVTVSDQWGRTQESTNCW